MRRQHFYWTYLVISILLIVYGGFFLIREFGSGSTLFISSIIALSAGVAMLLFYGTLRLVDYLRSKKNPPQLPQSRFETEQETETPAATKPEPETERGQGTENPIFRYPDRPSKKERPDTVTYIAARGYVRKIGFGPVLEINGSRIRDMRSNTYYRVEGGAVYGDGSGLLYQISGKRIRSIGGRELYELSGSNIYQVFGGYYASVSGHFITKYDGSEKYECDDDFPRAILLVIAVLLFGE